MSGNEESNEYTSYSVHFICCNALKTLMADADVWNIKIICRFILCSIIIWRILELVHMSLNKSWHDYNESLVKRGRILWILDGFLKSYNKKIKRINE